MAFILCLLGTTTLAEAPMTGAEFDAYATGRTLSFGTEGNPDFGVEQYLQDRQVIWSPRPGECINGKWFAQDESICFLYEGDPEAKCWQVYRTDSGIRAVFVTRPSTTVLFESKDNAKPLICPGPELLSKR